MITEYLYPTHSELPPEIASLLKGVSKEARAFLIEKQVADYAFDKVTGAGKGKDLNNEAQKLNILMMKRKLGLPLDDDDYEGLLNKEDHSKRNALASYGMKKSEPFVFSGMDTKSLGEGIKYIVGMPVRGGANVLELPKKAGFIEKLLRASK